MPQKLLAQAEQILASYRVAERNYKPEALREERKKAIRKLNDLLSQNNRYQSGYKDVKQEEFNAARQKLDTLESEINIFSIFKDGKVDYEAVNKAEVLKNHFIGHLKHLRDKGAVEAAIAEIAEIKDANVIQAFKMAIGETPPVFFSDDEQKRHAKLNHFTSQATSQNIIWLKDTLQKLDDMQLEITHPEIKAARATFQLAHQLFSGALSGKSEVGDKIMAIRDQISVFGEDYNKKPGEDFFK